VVLWTVLGVGEGGVLCEAEAAEVQHAISTYTYMRVQTCMSHKCYYEHACSVPYIVTVCALLTVNAVSALSAEQNLSSACSIMYTVCMYTLCSVRDVHHTAATCK
jgi:hypothetical protein